EESTDGLALEGAAACESSGLPSGMAGEAGHLERRIQRRDGRGLSHECACRLFPPPPAPKRASPSRLVLRRGTRRRRGRALAPGLEPARELTTARMRTE